MKSTNLFAHIARAWQRSFPVVLSVLLLVPAVVFAQDGTPSPDDFKPIADALSRAIAADGKVNWIIAAPLIVWALVYVVRKWVAGLIPGKVGEWLRSRVGGIVLAVVLGLATAFLEVVLKGVPITVAVILGILFKTLYAALGSMGIQTAQKNVRQQLAGEANATETAAATLARVSGAGPQP